MGSLTPAGRDWPSVIRSQLAQDPDLPRSHPTTSLWQVPGNVDVASVQSSALPKQVDYAVIGSGIASCGLSRGLLRNPASGSKTVGVFEARTLCSGATGRNGGQLTRLPPTRHVYMRETFGVEQAAKIMRFTVRGLAEMHKLAESQGPEFEAFSRRTRVEKFFAYYDEESWLETLEALRLYEEEVPEDRGVYERVSKEDTASIYKLKNVYGGLKFPAGVCSPYNLVTGTFKALLEKHRGRLSIDTNTPVTEVTYHADDQEYPYRLQTPRGVVRAAKVVHCTNGHCGHLVPGLRGKMYPRRGTISVQAPGPDFPDRSRMQSWSFYFNPEHNKETDAVETGRYYAFQHKDTGDLWVGGDQDAIDGFISADDSTIDSHSDASIRGMLPRLFSEDWVAPKPEVRGVWSGIMCYTGDTLPFIGRLPSSATGRAGQDEWIAAGWNTYGMTNGLLCGEVLGRTMLGEEAPEWFPESYWITEERLGGERFQPEAVMKDYFKRIGAKDYV